MTTQNWALITGASAGIGKACAYKLASQGANLVLLGRRLERLTSIKEDINQKYSVEVEVIQADIQDKESLMNTFEQNSSIINKINILINNAGLAKGVDPMDKAQLDDWDAMIDTNVKGLLYCSRLLIDSLKKNSNSIIVNIGSVAGRWTYPGGGVYCATKHAVKAISEGLRLDLQGQSIRVSCIEPGMVETEFSLVRLGDKNKADAVYQGMKPLTPEDIAETVNWVISAPKHVNIQEVVIFPTDQASVNHVYRV